MLNNSIFTSKTSKLFSPFNRKSIYLCLAFLNADNPIFDKIHMLQTFYYYYSLVDELNGNLKAQLDFTEILISDYYVRNNLDKIFLEMQKINDYKYFNKKYKSFIKNTSSDNRDSNGGFVSMLFSACNKIEFPNDPDNLKYFAFQDLIDDEDILLIRYGLFNGAPLDCGYQNHELYRRYKNESDRESSKVYNHANMFKKLILTGLLFWFIVMNSYGLRLDTGEGTILHYIFRHILNLDFENPVLTTKTNRYKDEYELIKNLNWSGEITKQDVAKLYKMFPMVNSENKR